MDKITIKLVDFLENGKCEKIARMLLANQINMPLYVLVQPGRVITKAAKVFQTLDWREDGLYASIQPLDTPGGNYLRQRHISGELLCTMSTTTTDSGVTKFRMFLAA